MVPPENTSPHSNNRAAVKRSAGGQPLPLTPQQISHQVHGEGAKRIAVVTDDPKKYPRNHGFAPGATIHHRDELDAVQRELRDTEGVSILIYDQTCAAELRRRRKRGTVADPGRNVFINDAVCEGCGDCSVKSNCVSIEPLETELGRKRRINQSSCNKDFSCLKGFCPSFVTVEGGQLRKARADTGVLDDLVASLPAAERPPLDEPYDILVTGIGGTGVITIGAILGMAANLEGRAATVLDQAGLAQKNGAVVSHVRMAEAPDKIHAVRIAAGRANLLLGCDAVVAGGVESLSKIGNGTTRAVINSHLAPTAAFTLNPDAEFHQNELFASIRDGTGAKLTEFVDATRISTALIGDSIATNMFMVGYALQRGLIPLSLETIERAIELNAVAVDANKQALAWGRVYARHPQRVEEIAHPAIPIAEFETFSKTVDQIVARRVDLLTKYQDTAYAQRYKDLVDLVRDAEEMRGKGMTGLAEAVARYAAKLMAYKDEYEVARLYTDGEFMSKLTAQFEGSFRLKFHLAPPLITKRDPVTGELRKREFGPWVFKVFGILARLKGLRGGPLDIFGRTPERRMERQLIEDYFALTTEISESLAPENFAIAVELAKIPEHIRGFGHVKERHLKQAKEKEAMLLAAFRNPVAPASAAE